MSETRRTLAEVLAEREKLDAEYVRRRNELQNELQSLKYIEKQTKLTLDDELLDLLRDGKPLPTSQNKVLVNAKTRLRRNGLIVNIGTKKRPNWKLTSD